MAESKLTIDERQAGDVTVLVLTGQMLLDDGDLVFRKRIHDLIDRRLPKVVVDLGGDMKLLNLTRRSESLFGMLKLLIVFETFEDEAAAVRSFARAVR